MKVEHKEAIDRARRHGIQPMVFAHELMVHDLVEAALFELRNVKVPFSRLGEDDQQEVIDRITKIAEEAVMTAVGIISTRSVDTIPMTVVDAKFKAKAITVTASIDAQDPNRHGLIDVAGKLCLMVLAPADYNEGKDGIRAERDQHELPLSAGAIAEAMYRDRRNTPLEDDNDQAVDLEPEPQTAQTTADTQVSKEFGDFDYDDATQLIVLKANGKPFKAHWVQSRLAISSEQVTTLLMRLLDDKVIEVEAEGESALDHSYRVAATLEDVVA
ncbi:MULTISPECIES: DNA translocase FtsK [unclassified Pseudomonas]|uniref:DNA translocase FtsK n=1 Tax=unclassified Pseudomonas TaxID=196821 RepID=UPI00209799B8|nr:MULTISPECIES: DNA translocase FtsK [unclassified Pseudomonas]MCO7503165.1 DNA translocase FtsK [Pseudomonas sp. VE 267-6A]MCO7532443.1 DNA translocase FtsK [Pseudomonas sp. 2]